MNRTKSRRGPRLLCLCILAALAVSLAAPARAVAPVDTGRTGTLTLLSQDGQQALGEVSFRLYRAGDMSEAAAFTLSGDFAGYPVSLRGLDASGWKTAANTLATYAAADGIAPLAAGKTDSGGRLAFGTLGVGLYLITGETASIGGNTYRFAPFLVCLPGLEQGESWSYDVLVIPKFTRDSEPSGGGGEEERFRKVSVIKHWVDDGNEEKRPETVTVALLRDGSVYDTADLSEDNYWRHTWERLSEQSDWSVVEQDVPEDYTVTYSGGTAVLTVTNTYTPDIPDGDTPRGDTPGGPDGSEPPNTPDTPNGSGGDMDIIDDPPPLGDLPQTGQLWWPVPVLAALGLAVFSLGWYETFRGKGRRHET